MKTQMKTPTGTEKDPDSVESIEEVRRTLARKPALRELYEEAYEKFRAAVERCPPGGAVLELGSGGGFAKQARHPIPGLVTSEVVSAPGVDRVVDATKMPFADGELRAIVMMNVFHHIPDVAAFLREAVRCLKPGGRLFMIDQYVGLLSRPLFTFVHHESFDPGAADWSFSTSGRMSGANGALAWIVFRRDRDRFEREFPKLHLEKYEPHTPLRYWWSGGLKSWTLLPGWAFGAATAVDRALSKTMPSLSSFVDIEIVRMP